MKVICDGEHVVELDPTTLDRGDRYEFPCGCTVPVAPDHPDVHGRKALLYDPGNVRLDCPEVWKLIGSGRTKGIFQLESSLGRHWAKRLKPEDIHQLAALTSILRPGTLKSKDERGISLTEVFCRRKNNEEPVEYVHESLKPILERTYGILAFQEQAMQISKDLAGFDLQEADILRKCVTGDTMFVSRKHGWITIDRLIKEGYDGQEFLVMDGEGQQSWKRLEKIWTTGKHDVNKVESASGFGVWATRYHQFLTADGWKARSRLEVGSDCVIAARSIEYDGVDSISSDLALVVAGIVAEGYFAVTNGRRTARFTNHDAEMMQQFISAFETCFGQSSFWQSDDGRVISIRNNEQEQLEPLINRGLSDSRRLPDEMMGMTKESTRRFLSYLLACEGGVSQSGQFEFSSKSPDLPRQVKLLMLRYGVRSLLNEYPESERYRLHVNDHEEQKRLLVELTGCWPSWKRDALRVVVENKKGKNFTTDTFPRSVVKRMVDQYPFVGNGESGSLYKQPISRQRLARVAEKTQDAYWVSLTNAAHCYDEIRSIEQWRKQVTTYDFTVADGGTPYIIANGLVIHNSIGKKDSDLMSKVRGMFLEKAKAHGVVDDETAISIFDNIQKSQRYQFNASHAYAYATDTYWSAHWKAHFPLEFFTSYLTWAKDKSDPLLEIKQVVNEARHFGFEVTPPRFSELKAHFGDKSDGKIISFGLADVKGVGDKAVGKLAVALPAAETLIGPVAGWSWFDFLTRFSGTCGATVVRRLIESGSLRDMGMPRRRMLYEFEIWDGLTEKEQGSVLRLGEPLYETEVLKDEVEVEVVKWPSKFRKADKEEVGDLRGKELYGTKLQRKLVARVDEKGSPVRQETSVLIDAARVAGNLEDAMVGLLERPGAITAARRVKVQSALDLLRRPPHPLEDTPFWIAKTEEEILGIPLTHSHIQSADRSIVNFTVRDFQAGREPRRNSPMILGVEVREIFERTVRSGDNKGEKMATMTIADETGVHDGVVCFPSAFGRLSGMLMRPGAVVALSCKRSYRDPDQIVVDDAWEI